MAEGEFVEPAPAMPPRPAGEDLSTSLLLEVLNRLSMIERQNARSGTQNEIIIAAQAHAEQSRAATHARINEISVNVATLETSVGTLNEARDALDPIVQMLRDAYMEKKTVRRVIREFCKNGYVLGGVAASAAGGAWLQWDNLRTVILRILGAKVGGP